MDWIVNNFQPGWVQVIVASCLATAAVCIPLLLWLAFWDWRERKAHELINYALKQLFSAKEVTIYKEHKENNLPKKKPRK